jgi:hypothetical protein
MTCSRRRGEHGQQGRKEASERASERTDHLADLVLLSGVGLLTGIVEDDVEEDVVAAEDAAHFAAALDLDEQPLVHELSHGKESGMLAIKRENEAMDAPF